MRYNIWLIKKIVLLFLFYNKSNKILLYEFESESLIINIDQFLQMK